MTLRTAVLLVWAATGALSAQAPEPTVLPITKVVLYKSGIGYFEHVTTVTGNQALAVQFTGDQLDDVLKSLTALDLGSGRVAGISYDSPTPAARRLRALRMPLAADATTLQLLQALRGSRVEVRSNAGALLTGRVLHVERRPRPQGNTPAADRDELTLVTDTGEIATMEIGGATRVRIADADLRQDVARYLDIASTNSDRSQRRVVLSTVGTGARQVFVSYVGEAAVWKTTYRLIFPGASERAPILQGWALVDNVSAADWENVELSLVAGAPQTFRQPLSAPLFATRPIVPLNAGQGLAPQLHGAALTESVSTDAAADLAARSPTFRVGGVAGAAASGSGTGGGAFRPGGAVMSVPPPPPPAAVVEQRLTSQTVAATGAELADLFEYRLAERVTIRRNQSALVPIVQASVTAERISLWNDPMGARPRRAVWITNTSPLTLDAVSLSVVDGGAFAGEGLVESLKPGERRLVSYAADLGVQVSARASETPQRVVRVRAARGILTQDSEQRWRRSYTIRNNDRDARLVIVEHPIRAEWTLSPSSKPAESTAAVHRFRVTVPAGQTTTLDVDEIKGFGVTAEMLKMGVEDLRLVITNAESRASVERALAPLAAKAAEVEQIEADTTVRQNKLQAIAQDQARIRENMTALKGSAAERRLLERYTRQLDEQESTIEALTREVADLQSRRERARQEFAELVATFSFDVTP
jgi:hypothetical protein